MTGPLDDLARQARDLDDFVRHGMEQAFQLPASPLNQEVQRIQDTLHRASEDLNRVLGRPELENLMGRPGSFPEIPQAFQQARSAVDRAMGDLGRIMPRL